MTDKVRNQIKLVVKPEFVKKYKNGYPLIANESIQNIDDLIVEGDLIILQDSKENFIGKGYYGKQNKGYGWLLSNDKKQVINKNFFVSKIIAANNKRKELYKSQDTNCFRVFNGEGDGIGGLTIDYFNGYYLLNWYSEGIYSFYDYVIEAFSKIDYKGIYQKKRFDTGGKYIEEDGFLKGIKPEFPLIVKENGVNFAIYLNEGAMVGVFLDQREVRKKIRDKYSKDKLVLNTFSYTGAFSVYAALGGAEKTISVDLANRSRYKTKEQFEINNIDINSQEIIVEDVFNYFKYANRKGFEFDLVILDPPSFARSKKFKFSASKDYKNLLKEVINITKKKGIIVASTNCSSFNMDRYKTFVKQAFNESNRRYKIVEEYSLPKDFAVNVLYEEGNYLKVLFLQCD